MNKRAIGDLQMFPDLTVKLNTITWTYENGYT